MCFQTELSLTYTQLENRFNAMFREGADYKSGKYSGFSHPRTPVIANRDPGTLEMMQWGLIPPWAKDTEIKKIHLERTPGNVTFQALLQGFGQPPVPGSGQRFLRMAVA